MRCPRCQHENRPQAKFCEECGGPLKWASPVTGSHADDLKAEVESLRQALTESLEQQTATAEILRVISGSPTDIQPVMDVVAQSAARFCGAANAAIWRLEGESLRLVATHGPSPTNNLLIGATIAASRLSISGCAVCDRRTIHVEDLLAQTEYPESLARSLTGVVPTRTVLATPLLREGVPIGLIWMRRTEVRPFTDKQIELAKTFAAQAVIAIENVRLFQELQGRNRELTEALEQQTATAEILRVISRFPTDVQPVFDEIARKALDLCRAWTGAVYRFDGELIHLAAGHSFSLAAQESVRQSYPMPPNRSGATARAILSQDVVYIPDIREDPEYGQQALASAAAFLSVLAVPMLQDGTPIGVITVTGATAGAFSPRQIELLGTFAAQATIAIENVRLFKELQARNRELTETLEQQTATSEVLRVISVSPTELTPVLDTILRSAVQLCGGFFSLFFRFDGERLHLAATHHVPPEGLDALNRRYPLAIASDDGLTARAVRERRLVHVTDLQTEPSHPARARRAAEAVGQRAAVAVPVFREGEPVGALTVSRREARAFSDRELGLLQTFAAQAVIAIENVRLFHELEARNRDLTEALEQQTATGEILRVIASSPTDLQPVLEAVVENAARVCGATDSGIWLLEGEHLRPVARRGSLRRPVAIGEPIPVNRGFVSGRVVCDRQTIHVEDMLAAEAEFPEAVSRMRQTGATVRTMLGTPLLREGTPLGAIFVSRGPEVHPFSAKQIALLETFANQGSSRSRTSGCSRNWRRATAS